MQQGSVQAYNRSQTFGDNPQETVAKSLLEAARRMTDVVAAPDDDDQFDSALLLNLRLWSMIAADILNPDNTMQAEVKSNLLSLHRFIDNHTFDVLSDRDPTKLQVLININRNISSGITAAAATSEAAAEGGE
jgi:flagellar protein FlaF